jgi:hypothetical protein
MANNTITTEQLAALISNEISRLSEHEKKALREQLEFDFALTEAQRQSPRQSRIQ